MGGQIAALLSRPVVWTQGHQINPARLAYPCRAPSSSLDKSPIEEMGTARVECYFVREHGGACALVPYSDTQTPEHTHILTRASAGTYRYRTHKHTGVWKHIPKHTLHTHTQTHARTHARTHTHTHTHADIHTRARRPSLSNRRREREGGNRRMCRFVTVWISFKPPCDGRRGMKRNCSFLSDTI